MSLPKKGSKESKDLVPDGFLPSEELLTFLEKIYLGQVEAVRAVYKISLLVSGLDQVTVHLAEHGNCSRNAYTRLLSTIEL